MGTGEERAQEPGTVRYGAASGDGDGYYYGAGDAELKQS